MVLISLFIIQITLKSLVWREVLLASIGEQLSDCVAKTDDIIGLSVGIRDKEDVIQIWHLDHRFEKQATIVEKIQELVPNVKFSVTFYKRKFFKGDFLNFFYIYLCNFIKNTTRKMKAKNLPTSMPKTRTKTCIQHRILMVQNQSSQTTITIIIIIIIITIIPIIITMAKCITINRNRNIFLFILLNSVY